MIKSSPGVSPKPRFGPNLDSTGHGSQRTPPALRPHRATTQRGAGRGNILLDLYDVLSSGGGGGG